MVSRTARRPRRYGAVRRRGGLVGVLLWLAIAGAPAAAGAQDALTSLRGLLVDADVEDGATDVSVLKTPLASLLHGLAG